MFLFFFGPWGMWGLSFLTRDRTGIPCIEKRHVNHRTTHISFLKNPIQLIFLFIFPSIKSYLTTSHLNSGNSSEGSILIPVFTVLQTPWVIFRVNLVNLPTYWTNWLFWKIHILANSFLITESASLWKCLFPCILATVLVFYCCCNCYNLSSCK